MEIITRKEAIAQGLKRYFTGKPCKHGHVSERCASSKSCFECVAKYRKANKEKLAEYQAKYRKANKEKLAESQVKYQKANKETLAESQAKYRKANKEKLAEYQAKYRKANKEKLAESQAKYQKANKEKVSESQAKYRKANKEKVAERKAKYYKNNPIQFFVRNSLNRIQDNWKCGRAEAEQTLGYTYEQLQQQIECQFKDGMSWDNRSEWHIDHIKPIKAFLDEGVTDPAIINALSNLQPLWAKDNLSKGAKYND